MMGEYAEYEIDRQMGLGIPYDKGANEVTSSVRGARIQCPDCGKEINIQNGLAPHMRMKHNVKNYEWHADDRIAIAARVEVNRVKKERKVLLNQYYGSK